MVFFLKEQVYFLSNTRPIIVYFFQVLKNFLKQNLFLRGGVAGGIDVSASHLYITSSIKYKAKHLLYFCDKYIWYKIFTGLPQVTVMFSSNLIKWNVKKQVHWKN